jgi:hypothetical protein
LASACAYHTPGWGAFGKSDSIVRGPADPSTFAPSGSNEARIWIGTALRRRALQMLAAYSNAFTRCWPRVVPVLPPTGAAGVGSLNPSPGPSTMTISNLAGWAPARDVVVTVAASRAHPMARTRRITAPPP